MVTEFKAMSVVGSQLLRPWSPFNNLNGHGKYIKLLLSWVVKSTHPCYYFNGGLTKTAWKVYHVGVTASNIFVLKQLITLALNLTLVCSFATYTKCVANILPSNGNIYSL